MVLSKHRVFPLAAGAAFCLALTQSACEPQRSTGNHDPEARFHYGPPITLGEGQVRTYVVLDEESGHNPIEIGVAIEARAMEGKLPDEMHMFPMELPQQVPEPYRFVLFDWNPQGHAPPGVYDIPHFDFHFYWVPHPEVQAITRDDQDFAAKANSLPGADFIPPHYIVPTPPGLEPAALAEPGMGLHWDDAREPQLQQLFGKPEAFQPFTRTLIYGSWDGHMTFIEPMITREYLLRRTDETIQIPRPARYQKPGWYPGAYRIAYNAEAKEYRVAIIDFEWRE